MFKIFQYMAPNLGAHKKALAGAVLCTIGLTAMELLRPWPLKFVFDELLLKIPDQASFRNAFEVLASDQIFLLVLVISILVIAVLSGLFGFGQQYLAASVGQRLVAQIRQQVFSHIQRLSRSFHDSSTTGDLIARLTGDIRMMRELMVNATIYIADRSMVVIGMLVVMFIMDWQLTMVALFIVPILLLSITVFSRKIKGAARKQRQQESKITSTMSERISAMSVVQAFAREAHEDQKFQRQNNKSTKAGLVATRLTANLNRLVQVVLAIGTALVIWLGVHRVQVGALTPGELLVFTAYLAGLYKPVRKLASLTGRLSKATVSGERLIAILETESDVRDDHNAIDAPRFSGSVSFQNVNFSYPDGTTVFTNLSFDIAPGETFALVGASGAGKSTIASLLLRFYDPTEGKILIDGVDIRSYTLQSLRNQISTVLQDSPLFQGTIADNIRYGDLTATDQAVVQASKDSGLHDYVSSLKEGYDTVLHESSANLSGGQRQRVAIARALVRNTPIVILDEPMTGLDEGTQREVDSALDHLLANRTCLLITHNRLSASKCKNILFVDAGNATDYEPRAAIEHTGN